MAATIDTIEVVNAGTPARAGDDTAFVALHSQGYTGWYGPVGDDVARYSETFLDAVSGEPVMDDVALHTVLQRAAGGRPTAVASWAVGAIDCAAWDLRGQLAGRPVADLVADRVESPSRLRSVHLYASWLSLDLCSDGALDSVSHVARQGWLFTKWGLRRGRTVDPVVESARLCALVAAATAATGRVLAFDAVFTWDLPLAIHFANHLHTPVRWVEDPLTAADLTSYRDVPATLPVAVGEDLLVDSDASAVLARKPRALTLDVAGCGGLTRAIELTTLAYAAGVPVFPHGRSFVAGVHLAAGFPRAVGAVEYRLQWEPGRQRVYREPWLPVSGTVTIPEAPGLGTVPRSG